MFEPRTKYILDRLGVRYTTHPASHTSRTPVAEAVLVTVDQRPTLILVPPGSRIDPDRVAREADAGTVLVATDDEFRRRFPGCEPGTLPPLRHLWGVDIFADQTLADDEESVSLHVATRADDVVSIPWPDFIRLSNPLLGPFTTPGGRGAAVGGPNRRKSRRTALGRVGRCPSIP